jgi:two-component system nitrogen regulation sensor histidine kinase GlnL
MVSADQILDQQTTAVLLLDNELFVRYLNQAAEALLETSGQHLVGEPLAKVFFDPSTPEQVISDALGGDAFTKRGAQIRTIGGRDVTVDYTVSPMLDGQPAQLLVEIQPMDRVRRINRDDHHASVQETTRKLVRGLAHEIKNPLGGIRGAAQLLARELATEQQRDYTRIIIEEADRLRNLVDRMLGPSQLPKLEPVNLHQVLERVVQIVEAEAQGDVNFSRDYDPSLPEVEADLEQMIQAVLNIVRNAHQALDDTPDAEINLRTRIVRQFTIGPIRHKIVAQVNVTDNGPGVDPELFERMYYPMISGRADGTGLGLSIAQNIISQHGGIIECESQPRETTFTIYMPLEQYHGSDQ